MAQQLQGRDRILRMNDFTLLGLVQSEDWAPNFNAQDIFELGAEGKVDTAMELEVTGSFELMASGNTAGLLARAQVARTASGIFTGYTYNPSGAGGKNAYTMDESVLREAQFDLLMHEKSDGEHFDRSLIVPRCSISSITGRADANGQANEVFNFGGDFVVGLPSPYHDARMVPCAITPATNKLTIIASDASTIISTTYTLVYAWVDERRLRTTGTDAIYATLDASGGSITISSGMDLDNYTKSIGRALVLKKTPSTTFPTLSAGDRGTSAYYIKGYQVNLYIAPAVPGTPTDSEQWLKVQSLDWNIDTRQQQLRQLAVNSLGTSIYARIPSYPLNITANATVNETDWKDWKAMMNKSFPGNDVYQDSYDFAPVNLKNSFAIVVQYYTVGGTKIQTWTFPDMRVDGSGDRTNTTGSVEMTWRFVGTQFDLAGING